VLEESTAKLISKELSDRTTLSRSVPSVVEKSKSKVRAEISSCGHVALTSYGWTDDFRKLSYFSVTANYFDGEMNLRSCILDPGSLEERKTGEVLPKAVEDVIKEFGLDYRKVTIVTDNASNMISASRDQCCRISCFAHCLNLVVQDMLTVDNADFQSMMSNCKTLVRHFKHAGLQNKLDRTLKQECPTRWNSTYIMLESILEQYDRVYDILSERRELRYLSGVNKDLLLAVVDFLKHFKVASEKVCCDKSVTIHLVVPLHYRLLSTVCKEEESDLDVIRAFKVKGKQALETKVRLDTLHDVAALLNPCMKGLTFIPAARKKAALEFTRNLIAAVPDATESNQHTTEGAEVMRVSEFSLYQMLSYLMIFSIFGNVWICLFTSIKLCVLIFQ
jgi:hypothetical protein